MGRPQEEIPFELQFRLRTLFVLLTLAAVALAIAAPFVHGWSRPAQLLLAKSAVLSLAITIGMVSIMLMWAKSVRSRAGRQLLRSTNNRVFNAVLLIALAAPIFVLVATLVSTARLLTRQSVLRPSTLGVASVDGQIEFLAVLLSIWIGMFLVYLLTIWWGLMSVYLCERGVVVAFNQFVPWDRYSHWSWHPGMPTTAVLEMRNSGRRFRVATANKARLAEVLNQHLPYGDPDVPGSACARFKP